MFAFGWLIVIIFLALIEISTMSLVSVWFIFGAVGAMIASFFDVKFWIQLLIFVVASSVFLILTRPFVKKVLKVKATRTNADRTIGERAVVIEEIDNIAAKGQVKIFGQIWSARAIKEDMIIPEGQIVEVTEISGNKLIVKTTND